MERNRLGIRVRDALALEAFSGVELVAGSGGLDRKIFHINVMEVPDILDWVREGELLFTTLYSLRDNPAEQVALIPKLAEKKLAALAIKPKRYIQEIPAAAIEAANSLDFPLLSLPQHVSFSSMMEPLLDEIFNFQTELLHKSAQAHNQLLEVMLRGGGLGKLTDALSRLIQGEVAIVDRDLLPLSEISLAMQEWLQSLEKAGLYSSTRLTRFGGRHAGLAVPMLAGGGMLGFVMASGRDFSVLDEITLERAATVAALDIMNSRALAEVERRFRNEYVVDLVEGAFPSEEVARQRARNNNWLLHERMRVLIFRLMDFRVQSQKDRLLGYLREHFDDRYIAGELGRDILIVAPVSEPGQDLVESLAKNLGKLEKLAGSKLLIGIGRNTNTIREIKYSFRQARRTVKTASEIDGFGSIVHYDQLGIYRLLEEMSGKPELQAYVRDTLQPVLDYDEENKTELTETLRCYFEAGGNLKQVARELYLHYNTVIYRMERIEKLLGISLANPQQRLSLEVAVKAADIRRKPKTP